MNLEHEKVSEISSFFDWLDGVLVEAKLDNNARASALLALGLCDVLFDNLDPDQRTAVVSAHEFWSTGRSELRGKWMEDFSKRIDRPASDPNDTRSAARDRLVWASLNNQTGLSSYAGEFLIEAGERAGLNYDEMRAVVKSVLLNIYKVP